MFLFRSPRPFLELTHKLELLVRGRLWVQALIALLLGLLVGLLLGPDFGAVPVEQADLITKWLALPGQLFLRLIKMILVPLLMASIIRGLGATSDIQKLRAIGGKFFVYVLFTSTLSVSTGLLLARSVQPGTYVSLPDAQQIVSGDMPQENLDIIQNLPNAVVSLIPENPLASAIDGEMLGIVIFSIIMGIAFATRKNEKIRPLFGLMDGILEVCMTIVQWAMWLVPLAVFGLMARMASQVGINTLIGMGVYVGTVLTGLLIMLIFYLCFITIIGGLHPLFFLKKIISAQLLAFSTSSSAAVMPLSIRIAEEELHVDRDVAEVVVPLGATVNMDGTALYQSVAILFLAQMAGMDLSSSQMFLIVITLVLSSIGTPSTPGVGMVILGSVAANFGIPTTGLILILGVDRILDMCRTVLNVTGDLTACVILGRKEHHFLPRFLRPKTSFPAQISH